MGTQRGGTALVPTTRLVTFEVAGERYGIEASEVHSILRLDAVTRVPEGPPALLGVINLRSSIVPLVSLRTCFGLPAAVPDRAARIVVVEREGKLQGLLVDRVLDVVDVTPADVIEGVAYPGSVHREYFLRFVAARDGTVVVLDAARVLSGALDGSASP